MCLELSIAQKINNMLFNENKCESIHSGKEETLKLPLVFPTGEFLVSSKDTINLGVNVDKNLN